MVIGILSSGSYFTFFPDSKASIQLGPFTFEFGGPMIGDELERVRRIGDFVYGPKRR
jgi:hypothetical protein